MNCSEDNRLEKALYECCNAARKGYDKAKVNLDSLNRDIQNISTRLLNRINTLNSSRIRAKDIQDKLREQQSKISKLLNEFMNSSYNELNERKKTLDNFSITLFGRTMAGKSTLMEILTNGDGESIGKGSQRTTRDVRKYQWKGMTITDVPGIGAFDGQEDEKIAFKAAKNADLILFLITDDAPQPVEAKCLSKIFTFGKPVIGICNVKEGVGDKRYMRLFLNRLESKFKQERLLGICQQFNELLALYNPCVHLDFIPVHLHARFISGQMQYAEQRNALMVASRFGDIEGRIFQAVSGNGKFYRIRNFIDSTTVPMLHLIDILHEFIDQNLTSAKVLENKKRQFKIWTQQFKSDANQRICTCISQVVEQLRAEVPEFAESHYNDKEAGANWKQIVISKKIDNIVHRLQSELASEYEQKLSEISREVKSELSLVLEYTSESRISMEEIHDYKRIWNWGAGIVTGILGFAALVWNPLGWVAFAAGILGTLGSFLFKSREKKVKEAREKLSRKLYENINNIKKDLNSQFDKWFHKELLGKQLYNLTEDISSIIEGIHSLADSQREIARELNNKQKNLNRDLLKEVLMHLDSIKYLDYIKDIARISNTATMLLVSANVTYPKELLHKIEELLGEKVWLVIDSKDKLSIIKQAIGKKCGSHKISLENGVAHVSLNEFDKTTKIRVKLSQQLTGFYITL